MNNIQTFNNDNFGNVRAMLIDDEAWFVGKDVADVLKYSNASKAVMTHVDEEDKRFEMLEVSNSQNGNLVKTALINESGVYSLIFSSKLPTAKKFKHWVTSEVLPSIRKIGSYSISQKEDSYRIPDPIERAKRWIEEEEERRRLALEVKMAQPKVEYFDALVDSHLLTGIRETAKELKWKETEFVKFLIANSYMYRKKTSNGGTGKLTPYAEHVQSGLFEVKDKKNDNNGWSGTQVFITPKGKETFRLLHEASLQTRHI